MNLETFAVGIAGDVHQRAVAIWRSSEPMDRHDREKLPERPVIEQRLEDGKVADVLIAQRDFEFLHFIGHIAQAAMHVDDLLRELPVNACRSSLSIRDRAGRDRTFAALPP